jgi:N6-adenosine-specific RNA methylase IME4
MSDLLEGLPRSYFGAVLCDPPWRFKTYNEKGRGRSPDWRPFKGSPSKHYDTMSIEDIAALNVQSVTAADCALFLWVSWPMLKEAIGVIEAWGFTYKTCGFDWMKAHTGQIDMFRDDGDALCGMGYWTRSNTEPCLLATRGKPKRLHRDVRMGIIEPRREHSRKPDCVHGRIERLVAGPYLELFGRQARAGWTVRGNEVGKFAERQPIAPDGSATIYP